MVERVGPGLCTAACSRAHSQRCCEQVSGSAGDNAGNGVLRCGRAEGCEAARAGGLACEPATLTTLASLLEGWGGCSVNGASSQRGAGCEQDSLLERWGDPRFAVVKMDVEGDARARPAQGR